MGPDHHRRTVLCATGIALLLGSGALVLAAPPPRVIRVTAKKFVFVPDEIRVNSGETVAFEFTAPEVPMGFSLPDFGLRTDILPGKVARLTLTPDKVGSFAFLCDVFCGSGHEDMNGTLVVSG